jgi:two-component system NtrC family sensor kinase
MDRKTVEHFRLALFGRMVMGVSHEVDNHLSVVLGFAELLQTMGAEEKKSLEGAGKILSAGEKIAAIIKQFSHYVRPHAPVVESFSFFTVLSELVLFSRYDLGRGNVTLVMPATGGAGRMHGDSRDYALALLAVLLNGAEAMAGEGGALTVGTAVREGFCHVTVADQGTGINQQIMPRIFEEGFTTKPESLHSGMGLPVARHIVSGMGGDITVENLTGKGCLVTLRVPAT